MTNKPNILFILSDQHRSCDLGCYGNPDVVSPNFDAFAQNCLRLTNCISNTPVCVPIRGSLLTGYYPNKHRAITNDLPINTTIESTAQVLNQNGYHTGYIGKWHLGGIPRDRFIPQNERMGFREWKAANCNHNYNNAYYFDEENFFHRINGYESFAQTDMALEFIDRNSGDKPWALYLSWGPPHAPYDTAPEPYKSLFLNKSPALRKNVPETILQNLKKNQWLSRDDIIEMLRGYYAHIAALDECFGRLIENLKKNKQIENTIVVYTSDHGDMLGSQGICKKQAPYFESVNVPCMISWPGRINPGVSDEVFGLVDLPVTLLGITGLSFSEKRDGADLSKLLLHGVPPENHSTYISICIPAHQRIDLGRTEWYGVKTKKWTYAKNYSGEFEILFNDKKDPYQLKNLANDQSFKDVSNTLQQELAMHIECAGDKLLPWREYLKLFKYEKVWNSSQAYMNRPEEEYI